MNVAYMRITLLINQFKLSVTADSVSLFPSHMYCVLITHLSAESFKGILIVLVGSTGSSVYD